MTLPSAQDTSFEVGGQKSGGLQPSRMDVCLCFLSVRERSEVSGVTRSVVLKKDMKCFLGKKMSKEAISSDFSITVRERRLYAFFNR